MPTDSPAPTPLPVVARRAAGAAAYPALDLLDEAFHRLRLAPLATLGIYYAGTLPFVLLLLYFWADQSRNADAGGRAVGGTLAVAAAFLGMKICHAIFAARLTALLRRAEPAPWSWTRLGRLAAVQTILQPSGLFLVALASVPVLPLGWVYAFYQNVTVLGDGATGSAGTVLRRAARASLRWPRQNHAALSILSLLGLFVTLNIVIALVGVPYLLRMFTGEENLFTRSGTHFFLNTTFFAVVAGLSYLVFDPLSKAFYTLRCFYEESLRSGEDLLSDLAALPPVDVPMATTPNDAGTSGRRARSRAHATGAAAVMLLAAGWCLLPLGVLRAAPVPTPAAPAAAVGPGTPAVNGPGSAGGRSVSPPELGRSIGAVLNHRKFAWRVPRGTEKVSEGPMDSFFKGIGDWLHARWETCRNWIETVGKWLKQWWKPREPVENDPAPSGGGLFSLGAGAMRALLIGLAVILVGAILWAVGQHFRRRTPVAAGRAVPTGAVPVPDLSDDTVLATQLPEDEWLRLAQSLLQNGERRLALRAFYLSALSSLAARGLLAIARHKSNRDYVLELRRRAREQPELQGAFTRNVARFERVWYGAHPADDGLLTDFQADGRRLGKDAG